LRQITPGPLDLRPSCSADGKFIVFQDASGGVARLKKAAIDGGSGFQIGEEHLDSPAISPDGKSVAGSYDPGPDKSARIATIDLESGQVQNIYNLPRSADLSTEDGSKLAWTKDGRSILFLVVKNGTSNLWAQPIASPGGTPSPARQVTDFSSGRIWSFALSPNGADLVVARGRRNSDAVLISHFH